MSPSPADPTPEGAPVDEQPAAETAASAPVGVDDLEEDGFERARRRQGLTIALVVLAGVVAIGGIPWALGFGPFAARLLSSTDVIVHVINRSEVPVEVEVSFARPVTVLPGHLDTTTALTGPLDVVARNTETGEVVESLSIRATGPIFYNVLGATCLVIFDLTALYGGQGGEMRVHARVMEDERLFVVEAQTVVRPRHPAPESALGTVHWVEDFGCDMVRDGDDAFLLARAELRMRERLDLLEERRRLLEGATP
ncbi:MAG: hypothetical protein EA398_10050 [Deltaproteobacteria bacterium]|nr:MAG: hypothetical protein EA398_10050 [Deltaproteobacteria bacterium]